MEDHDNEDGTEAEGQDQAFNLDSLAGLDIPEKSGTQWEAKLDEDDRAELVRFEAWLVAVDGKKESTARAYRGYVAQATVQLGSGTVWTDLSTDIRSGVHAFTRFRQATKA